MMRFCPNCHTERPLIEIFCEGQIDNHLCSWDLSAEPIHAEGWRPIAIVLQTPVENAEFVEDLSSETYCVNGHPMDAGDLMCLVCGADAAEHTIASSESQANHIDTAFSGEISQIDDWQLLQRINQTNSARERYRVQHQIDKRQGVLTLYHSGSEPDPAVYDLIRTLPREHVPEFFAIGRWNERAWHVAEELTGGSLAAFIHSGHYWQPQELQTLVRELGQALLSFSEHGLRHRNLCPENLLIRRRDPLDIVIIEYGSACLSEFDLDIVSPLDITRYSAPETLAGGVAAASDWWSLGIILLEQITRGRCFEQINSHAFLIQVLANGVRLPEDIDPHLQLLLRGLLTRDRHHRWQWPEVEAWLAGQPVTAMGDLSSPHADHYSAIMLNQQPYTQPAIFALAAAEQQHWDEALALLQRGKIAFWGEQNGFSQQLLSQLVEISQQTELNPNYQLMLVLKLLNPNMPLIYQGAIVTPSWLLEHPLVGYELISAPLIAQLSTIESNHWLIQLNAREQKVRRRGNALKVDFDQSILQIYLLTTSRAKLLAIWEQQRRLFPDTQHPGLKTLIDRTNLNEEDLIVLLSADIAQYTALESLLTQTASLAAEYPTIKFDAEQSRVLLLEPKQGLYQVLANRIEGFKRCNISDIDSWAEHFLLTRRLSLSQILLMLAIPAEQWLIPEKQRYINQVLNFFSRKITASTMRGSLVRMNIGSRTGRVDMFEFDSPNNQAQKLLDHLLTRSKLSCSIDTQTLLQNEPLMGRLRTLLAQTQLYQRDTGIDGMYLGFPFMVINTQPKQIKPRIAPLLLWPVNLNMAIGVRGIASLAFDHQRGAVRLNPALENFVGIPSIKQWQTTLDELLSQASLDTERVMSQLASIMAISEKNLRKLPPLDVDIAENSAQLVCSAVLFHASFIGQAISEDIRQLQAFSLKSTALETALNLRQSNPVPADNFQAKEYYFTSASDPSQEAAVLAARQEPGLLIEGPPGTGKSQTIVNMVADAIGQQRSLLIVCQKPAALEVVYKRLVAGGLADRIIMLKDAQKARDTVRSVRFQLENLYQPTETQAVDPWVMTREGTARQIEQLEQELDSHYQAMYQTDPSSELSYRRILADLMTLEQENTSCELARLQPLLKNKSLTQLAEIKAKLIPLIPLWLVADYEDSPLSQLTADLSEPSAQAAFIDNFAHFMQLELAREQSLAIPYRAFEIERMNDQQKNLTLCQAVFSEVTQEQWQDLARWLPLFYAYKGSVVQGDNLLRQLAQLIAHLAQIDAKESDPRLFEPLAHCSDKQLLQLISAAEAESGRASLLRWLNPFYYVKRQKLATFLLTQGVEQNKPTLERLLLTSRIEQQWRLVRRDLSRLHQTLGLPAIELLNGLALHNQLLTTQAALGMVAKLHQTLVLSEEQPRLISAIIEQQQVGFETQCYEIDAAIQRQQARQASLAALNKLNSWLIPDSRENFIQSIQHNQSLITPLTAIEQALPTLAAYQQFSQAARQVDEECLALLALIRDQAERLKSLSEDQQQQSVEYLLDREARLIWKQQIEWRSPQLRQAPEKTTHLIEQLTLAHDQMREWNKLALSTGLETSKISPLRAWEEITRLTGRRVRRLREFIEEGELLGLMALRPVWLMTPDIASQVLPLKAGLFDTVIYDEASQMPVEFALPTLFRSKNMVVSGDEKQMPPSAFFAGKMSADEDLDEEDEALNLESEQQETETERWDYHQISDCPDLLHLARTVLPVHTLEIHYRSAYRELINFSNHAFYNNRLNIPVQHSKKVISQIKPISLINVNGLYHEQTNHQEAVQVVDLLAEIWLKPYLERPSVGVVTFNQKQAQLIQHELEARAEQDIQFRETYYQEQQRLDEDEDMSVFVKNVENVQGDERDVIIFSTTFGRNKQGTFRRNFGVLGQQGGECRLNVAITRARKQVTIVSSMPIDEISDLLTTQRRPDIPRDFLQGYLAFARQLSALEINQSHQLLNRMVAQPAVTERLAHSMDGFVHAVTDYIRQQGWLMAESSQSGVFYFDCIIEDQQTGRYLLGIECDMPQHSLLTQARARELWRPSVLARVTPARYRVSAYAWYHDGDQERQRLNMAIEQAVAQHKKELFSGL
nr:AAA domain-containing protein [uncultured Moellerella sp.]